MRTIILSLMASAITFASFSASQAADAIDEVPAAPAAEYSAPAVSNWAGAYVGGTGNWHHGEADATGSNTAAGFGGGLFGGYNMQNGQLVYGGEADVNYSGQDSTAGTLRVKQGINGSLRARVGVDVSPVLVYGTAGVAATSVEASGPTGSDKETLLGWTAGAGAETMVTDNITARVEYRYTDYASENFNLGGTAVSTGYDEHSVRVGMGVKF